jgi:hypothetical protein
MVAAHPLVSARTVDILNAAPEPVRRKMKVAEMNVSEEATDFATADDVSYTGYIAEKKRHECPKLLIKITNQEIFLSVK